MKLNGSLALGMLATGSLWVGVASATTDSKDMLIKFADTTAVTNFALMAQTGGAKIENLGAGNWVRVQLTDKQLQSFSLDDIRRNPNVLAAQPNYKVKLLTDYRLKDPVLRAKLLKKLQDEGQEQGVNDDAQILAAPDNPAIPTNGSGGNGVDPLFSKQWGMNDIGAKAGWKNTRGSEVIVAVIDTGVDYTHEDLVDNLWRNAGESGKDSQGRDKASNGVDDDNNGYIDDTIGWDFVSKDNKPYDLSMSPLRIVLSGGNPGHGTHCAGNVAARSDNGKGVTGVAPEARIMAVRFLSEKGEGTTAGAIQSIQYAVKNGAKVLSNSWGSEGEDPNDPNGNQALRDAIAEAERAGVLFIAAAGNGHYGVGYDNDSDPAPAYPASYDHENIVSVAALDSKDALGSFSNWGARTVDIGAPGVVVFSTTVNNGYSDTIFSIFGIKVTWDGTSMSAPHVSGAAALYWSKNPNASYKDVKNALLSSVKPVSSLKGRSVSGGKLNVEKLMQ